MIIVLGTQVHVYFRLVVAFSVIVKTDGSYAALISPPVQVPPTPSQFRSWVTLHLMSIVTMTTLTLHLWLVEVTIAPQFNLDYFSGLMLKYFFGNFEILLIPVIALTVDKKIRDGLFVILTAKKKGILSKTNSVYSEYM